MQLVQLVRRAQHILSRKSAQVMANMALAMLMLFGRIVKTLFFGTLRHAEIEHHRLGVADMEIAVRLGRKPRDDGFRPPGRDILGDDVADEVARTLGVFPLGGAHKAARATTG